MAPVEMLTGWVVCTLETQKGRQWGIGRFDAMLDTLTTQPLLAWALPVT